MLWGKMLKAMEGICKPQFVIYKFLEETFLLVWFSLKSAGFLGKKVGCAFWKEFSSAELNENWANIDMNILLGNRNTSYQNM